VKRIDDAFEAMVQDAQPAEIVPSFADKIRLGNIKARIRMIILYDMAQKFGGLVMSTDNLTELYLGFWTLHGDVGDLGLIQKLWKTDVYQMSRYLIDTELTDPRAKKALQDCIDAVPTDGLGITKSDLEQIGGNSYTEVDEVLYNYLVYGRGDKNNPIIQRYERTHFKRENPVNLDF
jgi:NAD+ synthetase